MAEDASVNELLAGFEGKVTTADKAVETVKSGYHVFLGTSCAAPKALYQALENSRRYLKDVQIYHFLADHTIVRAEDGSVDTRFQHKVFYAGSKTKDLIEMDKAQYIPVSMAQLPGLIRNGRIPIDVAMIQTSLPDESGNVSLGISVDFTKAAVESAGKVIAEVNPNMPWTFGDSLIPVDMIDHLVIADPDSPIEEYLQPPIAEDVADRIAGNIASLIDDGSTLQIAPGRIPNGMLRYLTNRRDLGIHSDFVCESIIDLIDRGVITGSRKADSTGQIVASYCSGNRQLYDLVDRNPMFSFHPIDYVCDPAVIGRNSKMVSVTQAWRIDLTGQVCADQGESRFYGGVATQPDFIRGAANSPGGKPIICLESTYENGEKSAIRPSLEVREGITIPRSDVHYVVTEYGIAYLYCKSIQDRALKLIEIAHPDHQDWLLEEAKQLGYVRQDHNLLESKVPYPVREERKVRLKNEKEALLRPAKASDVPGLQNVFYHSSEEDIRTRFFVRRSSLAQSQAEIQCNIDYETRMTFVAVAGEREREDIVGSIEYAVDEATNLGEIGVLIRADWQSVGLGTLLQQRITEYAKSKGLRGFTYGILEDNVRMIRIAQRGANVTTRVANGIVEVEMLF